ncbi:hypothetical protein B0H21DRAFT_732400 [Amylocystis lapponica]|nr:hypothetical protein B0H21DRAFT_732400 [Amylocystis lapponica]
MGRILRQELKFVLDLRVFGSGEGSVGAHAAAVRTSATPASARVVFSADHVLDGRPATPSSRTSSHSASSWSATTTTLPGRRAVRTAAPAAAPSRPRQLPMGARARHTAHPPGPARAHRTPPPRERDALTHATLAALPITTVASDLPMVRPAPACNCSSLTLQRAAE